MLYIRALELKLPCITVTLYPLNNAPSPLYPPLVTTILLSISMSLTIFDASYKRNHTVATVIFIQFSLQVSKDFFPNTK